MSTSCSGLQRERGGPILGTAPQFDALVLAECRRPWDEKIQKSVDFPPGLHEAVKQAESATGVEVKLLGIACERSAGEPARLRIYRRGAEGSVSVRRLEWEGPESFVASFQATSAEAAAPLLLVCTHGSRDRCCGSLGWPVAEAARRASGGAVEVLECSHVGGHRYAPNVLALPQWRCYGNLHPSEMPGLLDHVRNGTVLVGRHRGACWLEEKAQLAEGTAWEHLPGPLSSVEILGLEKGEGFRRALLEVRLPDDTTARYRVMYEKHEFRGPSSCAELSCGKTRDQVEFRVLGFSPAD